MIGNHSIWGSIPTENIIIFQTDTILRRFGIEEFISYNYIGVWIRFKYTIVYFHKLSFHKKSRMLEITNQFSDEEITMEVNIFVNI